jgi:transposase
MPKLEIYIRKMVIVRAKEGYSQRKIAANLKISRRAVQNIIKKYKNFKTVEDLPRSGRKRSYTDRDLRNLIRLSQVNPFLTARELRDQWKNVSIETVKGLLRKKNYLDILLQDSLFYPRSKLRNEWNGQFSMAHGLTTSGLS